MSIPNEVLWPCIIALSLQLVSVQRPFKCKTKLLVILSSRINVIHFSKWIFFHLKFLSESPAQQALELHAQEWAIQRAREAQSEYVMQIRNFLAENRNILGLPVNTQLWTAQNCGRLNNPLLCGRRVAVERLGRKPERFSFQPFLVTGRLDTASCFPRILLPTGHERADQIKPTSWPYLSHLLAFVMVKERTTGREYLGWA